MVQRWRAIGSFLLAIQDHLDSTNLLLIDSEGLDEVALSQEIRGHLRWEPKLHASAPIDTTHFMVQIMETWFLGDRSALSRYYGPELAVGSLPGNPLVEEIGKAEVLIKLRAATRRTCKGKYHKTQHAPDLLASLDVAKVRKAAPSCDRLFRSLESVSS